MKPGFRLNVHDREKNPLFESHDPSMMWDPVSGNYYSYSTDAAITSVYRQGIPVRRSRDLVNFEFIGYALSEAAVAEGRNNGDYPPTGGFWAPFTEYVSGEYRMYYSATKAFGSSESRIWLAVSKLPEGPFENRGIVADTWDTDDTLPNAIDPHVVHEQGRTWLVYGSFFGGIYLKELDVKTGLAKQSGTQDSGQNGNSGRKQGMQTVSAAKDLGVRIAVKPQHSYIDGPEGAAVLYHPEEGYFYLFLSYGWLGDDYDIRVGRSRSVQGPYLDKHGKALDGESLGTKIAGSYQFAAEVPYAEKSTDGWHFGGFRGPGHGVPFYNEPGGDYFFVHHVRDGAENLCYHPEKKGEKRSYRMHYMVVRRMYFTGGWPAFSPEPYAGEAAGKELHIQISTAGPVRAEGRELCAGETDWEWICFEQNRNELIHARNTLEPEHKTAAGSENGSEEVTEADVVLGESFDFENSSRCVTVTGYTEQGTVIWGKKRVII